MVGTLLAAAVALLGVGGVQASGVGQADDVDATQGVEQRPQAVARPVALRPVPAPVPVPVPAAAAVAEPLSLSVPSIDLAVPLGQLGLQDDGTVEVPVDAADAGWFRLGPPPGAPGSAVLLGHVDSYRGPGVFFDLHTLQVGDGVEVGRADGSTARFAVTGVETYRKDAFPAELVYGGTGSSTLQLVTCGGEFDRAARSYLSNVVVSADLVPPTPAVSG